MTGKVWRLNALFYWSRRAWQKKKTLDTLRVTFVYTNLTTPYKIHCTFRKKNSLHVTLVYTKLTTHSKFQYTFKKKKSSYKPAIWREKDAKYITRHDTLAYTNLTTHSKIQYTFNKKNVHTNLQSRVKKRLVYTAELESTFTSLCTEYTTAQNKKKYPQIFF